MRPVSMPPLGRALAVGAVFAIASAAPFLWASYRRSSPASGASSAPPPILGAAPPFELTDASGRRVASRDLSGPWIASFLFTRCDRQCPMMTARMKAVAARVPGVRLVSFSVDPRDRPSDLAAYSRFHRADWLFLSGKGGEVRKLCREGFKLAVSDGEGEILHSGKLVLVDGDGRIRGYFDADDDASIEALEAQGRALARLGDS